MMTQRKEEMLKSYTQHFIKEKIGVPNWNDSVIVKAFRKGTTKGQPFYDYLTMESPTSLSEVFYDRPTSLSSSRIISSKGEKRSP